MSKRKILKQQCKEIIQLNPTERVWQMPFFFALAVGFALSIAAYYDRMDLGLIAIIGIMAFVYTTNTPMYHRMAVTRTLHAFFSCILSACSWLSSYG